MTSFFGAEDNLTKTFCVCFHSKCLNFWTLPIDCKKKRNERPRNLNHGGNYEKAMRHNRGEGRGSEQQQINKEYKGWNKTFEEGMEKGEESLSE